MPITFQSEYVRRTYEKIGCYLFELGIPAEIHEDVAGYRVTRGSAQVLVEVTTLGDKDSLVLVASRVVTGARTTDPELMRTLLKANADRTIGGFCYTPRGDIGFAHSLVGSSCTRTQLADSLGVVTSVADEWDDKICEKWGGTRAIEPPAPRQGAQAAEAKPADDVGARVVVPPKAPGIGDGKAFHFLFGYRTNHAGDQAMLAEERKHLEGDIAALTSAGYHVVVEPRGTRDKLLDALYARADGTAGLATAGVYWSGHGSADGTLVTCDEGRVAASDVDGAKVSDALRLLVLSACYVGSRARTWRKSLGGQPLVVGWGRPVTMARALEFLDPKDATATNLTDLLHRFVLASGELPADPPLDEVTAKASVVASGSTDGILPRLQRIAEVLHAHLTLEKGRARIAVTLETGAKHPVIASVVHSTEPYLEGDALLGVEGEVGELSAVVDPATLLSATRGVGYGRVAAVKGSTESPNLVVQAFLPLAKSRDQDLAAMVYQVAERAAGLSRRIFGADAA